MTKKTDLPKWKGRTVEVYPIQKDYPPLPEGEVGILVCAPAGATSFTDNIYTSCEECGRAIMHRPHGHEGLIKLCGPCAFAKVDEIEKTQPDEEIRVCATEKTVAEVEAWRKGQRK